MDTNETEELRSRIFAPIETWERFRPITRQEVLAVDDAPGPIAYGHEPVPWSELTLEQQASVEEVMGLLCNSPPSESVEWSFEPRRHTATWANGTLSRCSLYVRALLPDAKLSRLLAL